jgi:hypothetical protein
LPIEVEYFAPAAVSFAKCATNPSPDPECTDPPVAKTFKIVIVAEVNGVVDAS